MIERQNTDPQPDVNTLLATIKKQDEQIALLQHELAQLKRLVFGTKSERFVPSDPAQIQLEIEGMEQMEEPAPAKTETVSYTRKKPEGKNKAIRTPIPADLPRKEEIIEPEFIPEGAKKIGQEITEVLEYTPGNIYVRKITRNKYALPQDEGVIIGDVPSLPIPKGNAGASMLAYILVSKFVDHLPFYRQQQIFKRIGLEIAKATFNGWFNASCDLIEPLYECLMERVLASDYLMGDESPIPVQDKHKKGSTHTGYHWVYYSPLENLVLFDYRSSRERAGPEQILKSFKGALQTDGYAAYNTLEKTHDIVLLGCMAHARRKFEQSLDNDRARAEHMLTLMGKLYDIEREAKDKGLSYAQRKDLRQTKAIAVLEQMQVWLKDNITQVLPKSPIGKAIAYTLNLWPRLKRYAEDGRFEIDNNLVENSIRPMALGRKNYLFAGSHQAAHRAAMMYSFFGTCKKNGIEPFEWLKNTLETIADHPANRLEELLPVKPKQ